MKFLVIGGGRAAYAYERALRQILGDDAHIARVPVDAVGTALKPNAWDGVIFSDAQPGLAPLIAAALARSLPILLGNPSPLRAADLADILAGRSPGRGAVTAGFFGPVSPGIAAIGLELAQSGGDAAPVSVLVEQQLAATATESDFLAALLEGVITVAHLAGNWPLRVAAVAPQDGSTPSVMATFLADGATTIGLNISAAPGSPLRRVRVVSTAATLTLEEGSSGGLLVIDGDAEPLVVAAGSEDRFWAPSAQRRIPVVLPDAHRAITERYLRRIRNGGADDLATLVYGLTLTERLLQSARRQGHSLAVAYRSGVQESPRLQLLRGGRPHAAHAAPASARRTPLTIVR